jgi:hypothetical protein|tara:strand:+ start:161 stop:1210 length:1050 start_codon:yes stop_codon:yes gene_type:complete
MKQHEREYFVAELRSGIYLLNHGGIIFKVHNPTVEQSLFAEQVYSDAYDEAYGDEVLSQDEMISWMKEKGLWGDEEEKRIEGLKKDLERLKREIFNARNNEQLVEKIRLYLRAGEEQMLELNERKYQYQSVTREGIASLERWRWVMKQCTFLGGEQYDFSDLSPDYVLSCVQSSYLQDGEIRELARNEPWKSLWVTNERAGKQLFANSNTDRELGVNQKNIIIWSQMYDGIHESPHCPADDVIEDDDMLDGWFLLERDRREKDKSESDFESSTENENIKNSDEIFVMANSDKDIERIQSLNTIQGSMVVKEREARIKAGEGVAQQGDFRDERLKMARQSTDMYKGKFGG